MPKVDARVQIDAAVLERVDSVAAALGSSRDQVIENSVRRSLASRALRDLLTKIRATSEGRLSEPAATALAYDELKAARRQRAETPQDPGPGSRGSG